MCFFSLLTPNNNNTKIVIHKPTNFPMLPYNVGKLVAKLWVGCPPTRSTPTKSTPTRSTPTRSTSHEVNSHQINSHQINSHQAFTVLQIFFLVFFYILGCSTSNLCTGTFCVVLHPDGGVGKLPCCLTLDQLPMKINLIKIPQSTEFIYVKSHECQPSTWLLVLGPW